MTYNTIRPALLGIKDDGSVDILADDQGPPIAPTWATDASGNVTGLVGPDGEDIFNNLLIQNTVNMQLCGAFDPWIPSIGTYSTNKVGTGTIVYDATASHEKCVATASLTVSNSINDYSGVVHSSIPAGYLPSLSSSDTLYIPFKLDTYGTFPEQGPAAEIYVWFSSDNFSTKSGKIGPGYVIGQRTDGWGVVAIPCSTFVSTNGQLITDVFNYVNIRCITTVAANMTCKLGAPLLARNQPTSYVAIGFDDQFESIYTTAFPIMQSAGVVGTMYVIADKVGTPGYCTLAQLNEMKAAGWHMAVHGNTQHASLGGYAAIYADVKANYDYVAQNFGASSNYAYPGGSIHADSFQVLADLNIKTARSVLCIGGTPEVMVPFNEQLLTLTSRSISSSVGLSSMITHLIGSAKKGGVAIFHGHIVKTTVSDVNNEISTADFTTFINYVSALNKAKITRAITMDQFEFMANAI